MSDKLHDLLENDDPTALPQIERSLASQDDLSADQDAVLSALIWRRCTSGAAGLLGSVLHQDCASRFEDLPTQLARVGATDAAVATLELRNAIPLEDEQINGGLADWIDIHPEISSKAAELNEEVDEIDQIIWDFMKDPASDIPDLEVPTRTEAVLSSIAGLFRPGSDASS